LKPRVFLDTNILISGIFFSGLESKLLSLGDLEFETAAICKEETLEVTKRKFKSFGVKNLETALKEVENSFADIKIIPKEEYENSIDDAKILIPNKINDQKVLAAALASKPDYFVTGDEDFHTREIKSKVKVVKTKELLEEINRL